MYWTITVCLNHACSFLENTCDAEVPSMYLIPLITSLVSCAHASKVNDAAPMVSEIQIISLRNNILSDRE